MSLEVDYLPVAAAGGANVDSQANFVGSGYQLDGFTVGTANPQQANKIWRQASMMAAAVANFIANTLNINVLDDGNIANLITNFTNAVTAACRNAMNVVVTVAYSATPVFDASHGNTFEIVLTGNVTSSTVINLVPGQGLRFIVKQDATGGHAFPQPTVPATAGTVPLAAIDTAASKINIQRFIVDSGSNVYVDSPLIVQ